jgi:ribonuclease BN (tRNA processing enzyme)
MADLFASDCTGGKCAMKVTLLGTNGWYDTPAGSTPCVLVQTQDYDIFFDAGYGFAKADRYVAGDKPVFLFLSHFHYDHLIGLHTLAKNHFARGLQIFGLPGIHTILKDFFNPTFTIPLNSMDFPITFEEMDGRTPKSVPFQISALPLIHSGPCQGYRLEIEGRVLTYCTDTGFCQNAVTLARGADLFLAECTLPAGTEANPHWPHLNPSLAAGIAREAGAKQLILIHFDASGSPAMRKQAEDEARQAFPATASGLDGMTIDL